MKSICVNMQKRCNIKKLTRIRDEYIMLLSNKLHSLSLPTRSHEADSGSPNVEDSHSIYQLFVGLLSLMRCSSEIGKSRPILTVS